MQIHDLTLKHIYSFYRIFFGPTTGPATFHPKGCFVQKYICPFKR